MRVLPSGTVTFLFTDIEGSTRLLQRLGNAYPGVLADHNRIIQAATMRSGGVTVTPTGDGYFLAFPSAAQALDAAVRSQRALSTHDWPRGGMIRVRMGLHAGTATIAGNDYVGLDVHRASRVASAGHGGQLLTSSTVHNLIHQDLPPNIALQDLGQHWLKDPAILSMNITLMRATTKPSNLRSEVVK